MFGYVNINPEGLSREQVRRYRAFYCGLCRQLGSRHGLLGRLTLSYDLTFLVILLTGLYEPGCTHGAARCVPHPLEKHAWIATPFGDYAADMSVALAFHNAQDDWADDGRHSALALTKALQKPYEAISRKHPRQCVAISMCLQQLQRCEQQQCIDLDEVSGHFGALMAELFDVHRDEWSVPLREMGFGLGKFIYLMDAYEDRQKDARTGSYNPLAALAGAPDYEEQCHAFLTLAMAQCAGGFEHLPILQDAEILRNILYSGIWTRYAQLQQKKPAERKQP